MTGFLPSTYIMWIISILLFLSINNVAAVLETTNGLESGKSDDLAELQGPSSEFISRLKTRMGATGETQRDRIMNRFAKHNVNADPLLLSRSMLGETNGSKKPQSDGFGRELDAKQVVAQLSPKQATEPHLIKSYAGGTGYKERYRFAIKNCDLETLQSAQNACDSSSEANPSVQNDELMDEDACYLEGENADCLWESDDEMSEDSEDYEITETKATNRVAHSTENPTTNTDQPNTRTRHREKVVI